MQSPLHILTSKSIMMTYLAPVVHVLLFVFKFLQQKRLKVHIMIFPVEKRSQYFHKNNNTNDIESYFIVS